jgi:hypothetical protein
VKFGKARRCLQKRRRRHKAFLSARLKASQKERATMRTTALAILTTTLVAALTIQTASASQRHHARKAPAPTSQSFRDSNAAVWSPVQPSELDWYRYSTGALSAPAGR